METERKNVSELSLEEYSKINGEELKLIGWKEILSFCRYYRKLGSCSILNPASSGNKQIYPIQSHSIQCNGMVSL